MILSCNSCGKKFVVPDSAITASGRMVQCGSCGNKWKQFPDSSINQTKPISKPQQITSTSRKKQQLIQKPKKIKTRKSVARKPREINLYSPEYLAKKHGIKLVDTVETPTSKSKVSFGFYNFLLLFLVLIIVLLRGLYFVQDFVILKLPFLEFYIDYLFESLLNMFEIWKNLISNY